MMSSVQGTGSARPSQVTLFLVLFKGLAQDRFKFVDRQGSLETIAQLGITVAQAKQEILGLTYQDYYRGPLPDLDHEGEKFWEFGRIISGKEVFIKLKAKAEQGIALCFSFHVPKKPMEYPYGQGSTRQKRGGATKEVE